MKRCTSCDRPYPDDSLNFCLECGSVLQSPNDPEATLVMPSSSSSPPLTEVVRPTSRAKVAKPVFPYLIVGLLALIVGGGAVALFRSGTKDDSTTNSSSSRTGAPSNSITTPASSVNPKIDNPKPISIPFLEYSSAHWDEYGPGYDKTPDNYIENIYMRARGFITYRASLPDTRKNLVVVAHVSSELKGYGVTSVNVVDSSDTTLIVNGQKQGMQNVIPDNAVGRDYQWVVPNEVLRAGDNEITLAVGDGQYSNGLTIFRPIQLRFQ